MIPGLETESDCAHEEEVAGEEFEVALHGLGNVVVVVLAEGSSPKKRGSQETGEDVNHDEGRGEKSGGGMGGEVVEELREVFSVSAEGPEDVKAEGDVEKLDWDSDEGFDDGISFAKGTGDGEGAHDFIKRTDVAGGAGGPKPECGTGKKEGELQAFDGAFFRRENGVIGKPGREKDDDRTENDQAGRD